jgi:hypothetical protein
MGTILVNYGHQISIVLGLISWRVTWFLIALHIVKPIMHKLQKSLKKNSKVNETKKTLF